MQKEIIQELRTPDRLRETLDVVDIVLGFLSTGGGRANQSLRWYINNTLKMKRRPFSEKVIRNLFYNGNPLQWTPLGTNLFSLIARCPLLRGFQYSCIRHSTALSGC